MNRISFLFRDYVRAKSHLIEALVDGDDALAFRVLRRRGHRRTATTYLATRTTEAVLLALAPVGAMTLALLARRSTETSDGAGSWLSGLAQTAVENEQSAYWLAMATLGLGSIYFCRAMLTSGLLPALPRDLGHRRLRRARDRGTP